MRARARARVCVRLAYVRVRACEYACVREREEGETGREM